MGWQTSRQGEARKVRWTPEDGRCNNGSMSKRRRPSRKMPSGKNRPPRRQTATPDGIGKESVPTTTSHWSLSILADDHAVRLTTDAIGDIVAAVRRAEELAKNGQLTTTKFQRGCRNISTPVRKLILPGGEQLLKRCFVPTMYPLTTSEVGGNPVTLTQWIGNTAIGYSEAGTSETRQTSFQSEHEHDTIIGTLYGLQHTADLTYQFEEPFDWTASPLRISQWLNLKVLQVDDLIINAETLLRVMANREGAHSELDYMATSNPASPVNLKMGSPEDEPYRRANIINFSGISYLQLFTFLVGFYLSKMMRATLIHIPGEFSRRGVSKEVCLEILQTPTQLPPLTLKVDRPYDMGVLLQNTGETEQPFKLIGDYQTPSRTVVRIP